MKRPAFQFYPGDWQRDSALRACSIAARGLWIEMMCVMHQAEPYGYLVLNNKLIDAAQLARMVGASPAQTARWMTQLEAAGVFSRDDQGRIFSRRMVRDEHLREVRAASGKLGGNPVLLNQRDNHPVNLVSKQKPTPSSSVFSLQSSTSKEAAANAGAEAPSPWSLFREGLQALQAQGVPEHQARSLLGKLVKHRGQEQAAADVQQAVAAGVIGLRDWIGAILKGPTSKQAADADLSRVDYGAGLPAQGAGA